MEPITFWTIASIGSGIVLAVLGASFLLKYTGVGEFFSNLISIVQSALSVTFSVLQSTVMSAPGFFKIIFFILLFWISGTFVYSGTIGLTHACGEVDGRLYSGSFTAGLGYMFLPNGATVQPFTGRQTPLQVVENRNIKEIVLGDTAGETTGIIKYDAWDTQNPDVPYMLLPVNYDMQRLAYFIASEFGTVSNVGGQDNNIDWNICYDKNAMICRGVDDSSDCNSTEIPLYRIHYNFKRPSTSIPSAFEAGSVWNEDLLSRNSTLEWYIERPGDLFFHGGLNWYNIINLESYDMSKCKKVTGRTNEQIVMVDGDTGYLYDSVYMPLEVGTTQNFSRVDWSSPVFEYLVPGSDSQKFAEIVSNGKSEKQEFLNRFFEPVVQDKNDIITFTCSHKKLSNGFYSDDEKFRMFGIPIFDLWFVGTICAAIVLLGMINFFKGR
jgi:hypothetical protein